MPTLMLVEAAWSLIRLRLAMGMGVGPLARLAASLGRILPARVGDRLRRGASAVAGALRRPCAPLAACCR